jgi:DedD protein
MAPASGIASTNSQHGNSHCMGLLSIFKSAEAPASATIAGSTVDAVQRARTRARQRLIGAAVLVVIGIIGFPLVFETQPRPVPVDIPIEVPRRDGAPALVMPAARTPATAAKPQLAPAAPNDVITESRDDAGREVAASGAASTPSAIASANAPAAAASKPTVPAAAIKLPAKPTEAAAPKPDAKQVAAASESARAKALLESKPTVGAAEAGRFIVQVGAFADAASARETRLKVEKLGLKTYTQVAATASGNRIRVRVGPFATRDEADKAMARAKGAGLGAVVLTL